MKITTTMIIMAMKIYNGDEGDDGQERGLNGMRKRRWVGIGGLLRGFLFL